MGTQSSCLFTSLALRDCSNSLHQFGVFFGFSLHSIIRQATHQWIEQAQPDAWLGPIERPRSLSSTRIRLVGSLHRPYSQPL